MSMKVRLLLTVCLGTTLVIGCAGKKQNPAKVSGTVTYKGAKVTGGTIAYATKDAGTYSLPINADGVYQGTDLPVGDFSVTVETESINPSKKTPDYTGGRRPGGGAPPPSQGKSNTKSPMPEDRQISNVVYVKIPEKYSKKDASPLKATLAAGSQTKDFELTD